MQLFYFFLLLPLVSLASVGCNLGSVELESGESISVGSCMECTCNRGNLNCSRKTCPPLDCRFSEDEGYLNGACCKTCIPRADLDPTPPCKYGAFFADPSNPCVTCTCHYGQTACVDSSGACPDLSNCSNVVSIQGQCCPICNATAPQEELAETPQEELAEAPPSECTLPTGTKHKDGESWQDGSCKTCSCHSGEIVCTEEVCPAITCKVIETKRIPLGKCCPRCVSRLIIDPPFRPRCNIEGEYLDPTDPCKRCTCYNGLVACVKELCPPMPSSCSSVARVEGQCCPVCQNRNPPFVATATSPQTARSSSSDATTARSTDGVETTATPTRDPSACDHKGRTLQHRERISDGPCSMCICVHGFVSCTQHQCPQIECPPFQKLVYSPDQCCPKCSGSSSSIPDIDAPLFTKLIPSAHHAATQPSQTASPTTRSPQLSLDSSSTPLPYLAIKVEDIPVSSNKPTTCQYQGKTLQNEETFSSSPCSLCICLEGYMACTQHSCPTFRCPPPQKLVYLPDQCCPQCTGDDSLLARVEVASEDNVVSTQSPSSMSTPHHQVIDVNDERSEPRLDVVKKEKQE